MSGSARRKNPTGTSYADVDEQAESSYDRIRGITDDVPQIAANTNIPEQIISAVRQHIFINEHDIAVGPNQIERFRFVADAEISRLWQLAISTPLSPEDNYTFHRLIAHKYVEQALMNETRISLSCPSSSCLGKRL